MRLFSRIVTVTLFVFGASLAARIAPAVMDLATDTREPWESFAFRNYVDTTFGEEGRYPKGDAREGWKILEGHRAPGSLVTRQDLQLSATQIRAIRRAFAGKSLPRGIEVPGKQYSAWGTARGETLVTFCSTAPSGDRMMEVYDEQLGRLVQVPAREHFVQAAIWLRDSNITIIIEDIALDQDAEMFGCMWEPQDLVDIDHDGDPEVVILEHGYEYQLLRIFTLTKTEALARWSGFGYSI